VLAACSDDDDDSAPVSTDRQLFTAVTLWIAASLARLRRLQLRIDNAQQLSQVTRSARSSVCLSVCHSAIGTQHAPVCSLHSSQTVHCSCTPGADPGEEIGSI